MRTPEQFRLKADRADENADAIMRKASKEYRPSAMEVLWIEANRCRANAARWRRRAHYAECGGKPDKGFYA